MESTHPNAVPPPDLHARAGARAATRLAAAGRWSPPSPFLPAAKPRHRRTLRERHPPAAPEAPTICSEPAPALPDRLPRLPAGPGGGSPAANRSVLSWFAVTAPGAPATASTTTRPNDPHRKGLCQRLSLTVFQQRGHGPLSLIVGRLLSRLRPTKPLHEKRRYLQESLRLLTARATVVGRDLSPLRDGAFSRHTYESQLRQLRPALVTHSEVRDSPIAEQRLAE